MKAALRQYALDLGFDDCRITTAAPPDSESKLHAWLASGQHGEMAYLQRNAPKRSDPQLVLPGARSVICLATSYNVANSQSTIPNPKSGLVARYAQFAD